MALAPRGPDGGGRHAGRLGPHPVTLATRRLALVDPAGGRQPFVRPSGAVLVMNGEVYNHERLRRELEARGETFRTRCDGEVLAALLDREGAAGLARVEGSYAFAFLGAPAGPLLLGRDPSGVRPLCYARTRRGLVFASTIEGVLATGLVPADPDPAAIADVLRNGVVSGTRTAIRGVERVAPGEVVRVDGALGVERGAIPPGTLDETAFGPDGEPQSVLDALRAAVGDRLRLDRPAGVFLSGGIDSSLIAALARERGRIPAYTVTFPGHGETDEGRRAERTAKRLGLPHAEVPCPEDPTSWVLGAARAFDEPFADASAVPTWGLAKAAGASLRAALTGTGGDEVFGGYRRYWLLGAGPWLRHVPAFVRAPVSAAIAKAAPSGARLLRAAGDPEGLYRGLLRIQTPGEARRLAGPLVLEAAAEPEPMPGPGSPAEAMADDRRRYLPDDLLVKEDRALMAHGIEGRHPFLDRRVVAAASRIELSGGAGRGRQKQVLRAFVREVLDPDLSRAPKHGFSFPVDALYAGPLCPLAEEVLTSKRCRERGLVDAVAAQKVLRDHLTGKHAAGAVVHALVMIESWARRVLDRASA
jgi:asparagine synthase (glutamine-hydrolysing)